MLLSVKSKEKIICVTLSFHFLFKLKILILSLPRFLVKDTDDLKWHYEDFSNQWKSLRMP